MGNLVWAKDRKWKGVAVKAGDDLPVMPRDERVALYTSREAVRKQADAQPVAAPSSSPVIEPVDPDKDAPR